MGKKLGSGPGMNNPELISESLETTFLVKNLSSLLRIRVLGSGGEWKKFESGIRDKHLGSATPLTSIALLSLCFLDFLLVRKPFP
jgi:hypothetical protein